MSRAGWIADGVQPNNAVGFNKCEFRVLYRDIHSDVSRGVAVDTCRYQTPLSRSAFVMHLRNGESACGELTYARSVWLGFGTYWYGSAGSDGYNQARGVLAPWTKEPIIHRTTTAAQIRTLVRN